MAYVCTCHCQGCCCGRAERRVNDRRTGRKNDTLVYLVNQQTDPYARFYNHGHTWDGRQLWATDRRREQRRKS